MTTGGVDDTGGAGGGNTTGVVDPAGGVAGVRRDGTAEGEGVSGVPEVGSATAERAT